MLSWIASDFFARSPLLLFPILALGIFFSVYVAASLRALFGDRAQFDALANLPFEESEVEDHG